MSNDSAFAQHCINPSASQPIASAQHCVNASAPTNPSAQSTTLFTPPTNTSASLRNHSAYASNTSAQQCSPWTSAQQCILCPSAVDATAQQCNSCPPISLRFPSAAYDANLLHYSASAQLSHASAPIPHSSPHECNLRSANIDNLPPVNTECVDTRRVAVRGHSHSLAQS